VDSCHDVHAMPDASFRQALHGDARESIAFLQLVFYPDDVRDDGPEIPFFDVIC